jgi:hypothetical protein
MAEVLEHLLCKCEAQSSNPSPTGKKKTQTNKNKLNTKNWKICRSPALFNKNIMQ